jgi:hypothetical protein
MAKLKRKQLNVEIGIDPNSDVEQEVEVRVVGSVDGSAILTREIHIKRTKSTAMSTDTVVKEPQPPVAPEETKK